LIRGAEQRHARSVAEDWSPPLPRRRLVRTLPVISPAVVREMIRRIEAAA
jgi:hypothetical protein